MLRQALLSLFAFVLGTLCAWMFFTMPLPAMLKLSSGYGMWGAYIVEAAGLFAVLCFVSVPRFRHVVAYCLPITGITFLIGAGKANTLMALWLIAEPVAEVWIGALLVWFITRTWAANGSRQGQAGSAEP